jgi:MoxR-like ATPase
LKEGYAMSSIIPGQPEFLHQEVSKESGKTSENNTVDLHSLFTQVMSNYLSAKNQPFANNPTANLIRNKFRQEIYKTGFITSNKFVVTGSPGQGNWASVPWIGIFNKSITTSATKGVYIVYLFSSDCKSVYLTLNQGCTELKSTLGKNKAVEIMRKVAGQIAAAVDSRGFLAGDNIDLKDPRELPYLYERGTIFYKEYKKGEIPPNDVLLSDLKKMVDIYDEYVIKMQEDNTLMENNDKKSNENNGEIKMSIKDIVDYIHKYISAKGFSYEDSLIKNFYLSLKSKPFVILAGTSGTGKTKLVKLFADCIGAEYKLVPVRPDWSDSSDLFGHLDLNGRFIEGALIRFIKDASKNTDKPYILCLDEMNLARVEYYFSDFLSIMETRRFENGVIVSDPLVNENVYGASEAYLEFGKLGFPENLYIIGTVNMDETTFPFSRKVLDRANTIEFSYVDLVPGESSLEEVSALADIDNDFLKSEYILLSHCDDRDYIIKICTELQKINEILKIAEAHVGYRIRDEICFYMLNNKKYNLLHEDEAFDYEILQKVLPRIQGSNSTLKDMLIEMFKYCAGDYTGLSGSDTYEQMQNYINNNQCKYKRSASKIAFMVRRFEEDGFTSYWL